MSQATLQLLSRAQGYREQARRARRLSRGISGDDAVARMQRYADQLDRAAARMEREAAAAGGLPAAAIGEESTNGESTNQEINERSNDHDRGNP